MSTLYLRMLKFVIMVIMIIHCWRWLWSRNVQTWIYITSNQWFIL